MFVFKIIAIIKEVLSSFETMDLFQVVFVEHLPGIEVDNGMCWVASCGVSVLSIMVAKPSYTFWAHLCQFLPAHIFQEDKYPFQSLREDNYDSLMLVTWLSFFLDACLGDHLLRSASYTSLSNTIYEKKINVRKEGLFCLEILWFSLSWPEKNGGRGMRCPVT